MNLIKLSIFIFLSLILFSSCASIQEAESLYKKGERALRDIRLKNLGKKSEKELKHKVTSK